MIDIYIRENIKIMKRSHLVCTVCRSICNNKIKNVVIFKKFKKYYKSNNLCSCPTERQCCKVASLIFYTNYTTIPLSPIDSTLIKASMHFSSSFCTTHFFFTFPLCIIWSGIYLLFQEVYM